MAIVTLAKDPNQQVRCKLPELGEGIQEILIFPALDPKLGADQNSTQTQQEVWILEEKRLQKFLAATEKYDTAAQALAEAQQKLSEAQSEAAMATANQEVVAAQDQMRATLCKGYGEKRDSSVMPIPQGSTKKLVECIGLVNKKTFYIATHDLKKVQDTREGGSRKFRLDISPEAESKKMYEIFKEIASDSNTGQTDNRKSALKKAEKNEKAANIPNYIQDQWRKNFFKKIRSGIAKEWKFAEKGTEGQLKIEKIKRLVKNDLIRDFLLSNDHCELIDGYINYLNESAHFSYQQKEQKLESIKKLLSKSDDQFDHYDWGQVLLGVQQLWNATDREFVEDFNLTYQNIPLQQSERNGIVETLYAHPLPKLHYDASGGAQFMRYRANCGGVAKFSLEEAKLAYKAEAKFSLLEAGVAGNYYFPHNLGAKLAFRAPVIEECFVPEQIAQDTKAPSDRNPSFAHNSSFVLPNAVIDIALQLQGLDMVKASRGVQELVLQVVGHTDTSGSSEYNQRMGLRRAQATHAVFTDNKAQWQAYFDQGVWGDEERDMIQLSVYMLQQQPHAFQSRWVQLQPNDTDQLPDILLGKLLEATENYGYPITYIRTAGLRQKIQQQQAPVQAVEKPLAPSLTLGLTPAVTDAQLIATYFDQMRIHALQVVPHITAAAFDYFYVDTELHPIFSHGEDQLDIPTADDEKTAANRRVSLIPWGVARKKQKNTAEIHLGHGRVHIHGQVTGAVGATLGMAAHFELNTYNGAAQLLAKKKKTDKVAQYNGKEIQPTKLGKQNATAQANAAAFAGAKAEAALSAALEWNNPESNTQKFGVLASIGGTLTGTAGAGIEGEFRIGFDQRTSTFQIKMKAIATWGLGGGGAWSFSVGVQQLYDFIKLVYHKLEAHHFNFLDIFEDEKDSQGKQTESEINVYEVYTTWVSTLWEQEAYFKAGVAAFAGDKLLQAFSVLQTINVILVGRKENRIRERETEHLIANIHAQPEVLHFVPPEAKGRMLYKIITYKSQSWGELFSTDHYKRAEEAALHVIKGVSHWREWQETLEHLAIKVNGNFESYKIDQIPETKKQRLCRMNQNILYLRNALLNDTDDWLKVCAHIKGLQHRDKAWNMEQMQWNTKK